MSGFKIDASGRASIISSPADVRDYSIDWSGILPTGDAISTSAWSVPVGLTAGVAAIASPVTTQWISGGTDGTQYLVTNTITTAAGRSYARAFTIQIRAGI